jgi:hypothetical protein
MNFRGGIYLLTGPDDMACLFEFCNAVDELPPGSGAMGFAFAKAGISAEMFQSVGA